MFAFGREKPDGTIEFLGMSASETQAFMTIRNLSRESQDPIIGLANGRDGTTAPCCRFVGGELVWSANPETPAQKRCCGP